MRPREKMLSDKLEVLEKELAETRAKLAELEGAPKRTAKRKKASPKVED